MYGVSDGHLKSYVYNHAADMYFDYGCHDDLEGVCVDDINRRFYLAQKVKAKRVTGSKKVARRRKIVSMEAVGLKPRRFRMEPPNLQDEFILEYSGGEEVLDVKNHPSGMLLVCTTGGIYGARVTREYSQTIYPS